MEKSSFRKHKELTNILIIPEKYLRGSHYQ